MNGIFIAVLLMSATGTLLLLCLLLLRPLTRRIFNATWHYRICILIVLFLLIPVGNVGGSLADGVQNLTRHEIPQAPAVLDNMPAAEPYIQAPLRQEPLQADIEPNEPVSHADSTNIKALLPYFPHIWLAGALSFLLWHVIQFIRFKRKIVSASLPPVQPEKLSVLGRCASDMKLKKAPCLYTNSMVETPMLTDLFKTRLLLPEIQMDDRELYVIFRHELIHFKRYDLLVKFLAIMANAVHWFNPAAYWLTRNINTFCELSCDEQVVAGMTAEERHFYGETILNVLCRVASRRSGLCATLAESKNGIEKRLSHMMNVKKSSPGVVAVSVAAAMVLCLSGFAAAAVLNGVNNGNNPVFNEAEIDDNSVVLFSLSDDYFNRPLTEIPYYEQGNIKYMPEYVFEQHREGHQPWLSGAVDMVTAMCSNLIGQDIPNNYDTVEVHTARELKTRDGVHIQVVDESGQKTETELTVPGAGKYDITLESPENTEILFIRKIVFHPDVQNEGQTEAGSTLIYSIEDLLSQNNTAYEELPDYESGDVVPGKQITYDEWLNKGGHQPWRREPFFLMRVASSNLVPEKLFPRYLEKDWTESGNTASNDGITVTLLSPSSESLNPPNASMLTYELAVPQSGLYEIKVLRPDNSAFFIISKIVYKGQTANNVPLTASASLEQLVGSIRYYDGGEVSFQIPENYSDSKDWNILVSGRLQYEDGFSRSMHLMDDINSIHGWEPGVRYGFRINDAYTELNMTASLPGENGEPVVKSIELPIMAQFQSDKQEILTLVNSFGQALKSVTLTAPDDIAAKNIEEHYSKYVTPELLSLWQADPQKAPGRKLSSPWPDRIDITGIGPVGDEEYTVSGEIIEVTSTELQNGTAAAKYPVTMRITKRDNRWLISGATINRNNNLTLEDFKKAKKIDEIIGEPGWEDTDLFILAELPGEDITMYGMKDADGRYENVAIRAGENINYFKWSYYPGSHDAGMSYKDYDNDGVKELAVHLYLGGGTGISTDQLFMLEEVSPGVFEPIQFESDDYVSQVENMVSCQVDEEEQTISLLKGGTELQRGDISWLEGEKVKSVRYGDIVEFDLSDGILMRITPGILVGDWVSPQYEGLSDLEATVEYHSDGTFHITDIR